MNRVDTETSIYSHLHPEKQARFNLSLIYDSDFESWMKDLTAKVPTF
jgi:hypothetical protein